MASTPRGQGQAWPGAMPMQSQKSHTSDAKESVNSNVGYRVDFGLDELESTNGRIIASCVRFNPSSFFVPREQPVHLLFLRLVFNRLQEQCKQNGSLERSTRGQEKLPVEAFHRAFDRLFFVLQDRMGFNVKEYDQNGDGYVAWAEFFNVYRQRNIKVRLSRCERIFLTFDDPDCSVFAQILSLIVLAVIVVSSGCFILSTMEHFQVRGVDGGAPTPAPVLKDIDTGCLMLFTVEYFIRLATCWNVRTEIFRKVRLLDLIIGYQPIHLPGPAGRVLRFVIMPSNLIDLAAILPGLIALVVKSEGGGFVVLRLIRLTRIFRAFKSPAFLEPVIIIGRTLQQSTKALYVLAFNLLLGVVISGCLMYIAEGQGRWDETTQSYLRTTGRKWNATIADYEEVTGETPFRSIPHTFWWAIVTITTVGYGDDFPTTGWGYVVTTLTMVFSLVMLALPVGVIGGTFSKVWSEFADEKGREQEMMRQEMFFVTTALQRLDPDQMCRMMLVEVWDDHGPFGGGEAKPRSAPFRFMGEVMLQLDLPGDRIVCKTKTLSLQPNMELVARKVSGEITLRYQWTPTGLLTENTMVTPSQLNTSRTQSLGIVRKSRFTETSAMPMIHTPSNHTELHGVLQVTLVSADRLINVGSTGRAGISSPHCVVFVYPMRPLEGGLLQPCVWRGPTAQRTVSPRWEVSHIFHYDWTTSKVLEDKAEEKEDDHFSNSPPSDGGKAGEAEKLSEVVLHLQALASELRHVKEEVRTLGRRLDWLSADPESPMPRPLDR